MSKFDELCKSYSDARKYYFDYQESCFQFAGKLVKILVDYIEIPKEQIDFVPLKEDIKPNTKYSIPGSMHLDDDSYWHLGIKITVYEKKNICPHQPLLVRILIKKKDSSYIVKLGIDGEPIIIRPDIDDDFNIFSESLYKLLKNVYEGRLQKFLEKEEVVKRIGF